MLFGLSILPSRHPPPVWSLAVLPLLFRSRQHSANLPLDGARSSETDPARCGTRHFVVAPLFGLLGGLSAVTLQSAFRPPRNGSPCRFARRLPGVFAGLSPLPRGWPAAPWTKRNARKIFSKKFVFFALASTAGLKIPSQYLDDFRRCLFCFFSVAYFSPESAPELEAVAVLFLCFGSVIPGAFSMASQNVRESSTNSGHISSAALAMDRMAAAWSL